MVIKDIIDEFAQYTPQFVATIEDRSIGLLGYVIVDTTVDGRSCGGLRLFDDVSVDQLKALAHGMTLKYGFTGMAMGGAKAGIVADAETPADQKNRLICRFGEMISPLLRSQYYISGPDMSISHSDIYTMMASAGMSVAPPRRDKGHKSGFFTALGVMVAIEAAAESMGKNLSGVSIAIEGFGSVGSSLAWLMATKKRARVVAVSTIHGAVFDPNGLDVDLLLRLKKEAGNRVVSVYPGGERINNEDLVLLDVDVFSPCARQFAITMRNVQDVKAPIVCPGANNPVTGAAERILFERRILSIPYFAANCGGVLGNRLEVLEVSDAFIESFIRKKNRPRILDLIITSRDLKKPMHIVADRYAMKRFRSMQEAAGRRSFQQVIQRKALRLFNTGLMPPRLLRPLAPWYFERTLGGDPPIKETEL